MLDDRNLAILALLQADAEIPVGAIADKVKISISACSRRIGLMRADGYIKQSVTILDRKLLGVSMTVFVLVKAGRHAEEWIIKFKNLIATIPEVQEAHRLAGSFDYIMKLALPNIDAYDLVYKRLVCTVEPLEISGLVAMETLKEGTILPLSYATSRKTGITDNQVSVT